MFFVIATFGLSPWFALVYAVLTLLGVTILGGKKCKKLAYAGISPLLSFIELLCRKDFSRWEHTRKH